MHKKITYFNSVFTIYQYLCLIDSKTTKNIFYKLMQSYSNVFHRLVIEITAYTINFVYKKTAFYFLQELFHKHAKTSIKNKKISDISSALTMRSGP